MSATPILDRQFLHAYHRRRDTDAVRLLETCLTLSHRAPTPLRDALISEAAVFQARRCHRLDLAEARLADLPPSAQTWLRLRAEAAILEARHDAGGAVAKLADCERALSAAPDTPQRTYSLRLLRRW
jgi:hypothetical protein